MKQNPKAKRGYSRDGSEIDECAGLADGMGESPYVAAKIAQHRCALELGEQLGLDVRMACPTMTLGPSGARLGPSNGLIVAYLMDPLRCTYPGGCNLVSVRDVAFGGSSAGLDVTIDPDVPPGVIRQR